MTNQAQTNQDQERPQTVGNFCRQGYVAMRTETVNVNVYRLGFDLIGSLNQKRLSVLVAE